MTKLFEQGLLAVALMAASGGVLAEGFYVGAEVQQTRSYSEGDFCFDNGDCDIDPTGYRVDLGYHFSEMLALELGYMDAGDNESSYSDASSSQRLSVNSEIVDLSLLGTLPLTDRFSLFGRLGAAWITNNIDLDSSDAFGDISDSFDRDVTTYEYGVGLAFGWLVVGYDVYTDNEVEYNGTTLVEDDIKRIYAGVKIGF